MKAIAKKFNDIKLTIKLPVIILLFTAVAIIISSYLSYKKTEAEINHEKEVGLLAMAQAKKSELGRYFDTLKKDLHFNSINPFVVEAQKDFTNAWRELVFQGVNPVEYLQKNYITDNPEPTGSKHQLMYAEDGSTYSNYHRKYHPWMKEFLEDRGYYDIFLFDLNGNLVYSVFKELDYATNINTGKWKDTDLGNAFRAARDAKAGEQKFFDFKPYAPSFDAPASFMSTQIIDRTGKVTGVLVYQMPIDEINSIMQTSYGVGETGEISIVGEDYLMRNASKFSKESTILKKEIKNEASTKALNGESGALKVLDKSGKEILTGYVPFKFMGKNFAMLANEDLAEIYIPLIELRNDVIVQALILLAVVGVLGWLIAGGISRRVSALAGASKSIEDGNSVEIPSIDNSDEIGGIAKSLSGINEVGQKALRVQNALNNVSGNIVISDTNDTVIYVNKAMENLLSIYNNENEFLGVVSEWVDITTETSLKLEIADVVNACSFGDFTQKIDTSNKEGFYLELSKGVNEISETSYNGLILIKESLEKFSEGDLNSEINQDLDGLFDEIKQSLNGTLSKFRQMVGQIKEVSESVNDAAREIAAGSNDLAQRTETQASTLEETAASMEEITGAVQQNTENSKKANTLAKETSAVANEGKNVVTDAVEAMQGIQSSSQKISDIIGVIDDIAFQTNLLALNASVEAARAGEAGKGFAVVASEVRSLAGRSAESSKEIKDLINNSVNQVEVGAKLVEKSGKSLEQISEAVEGVETLVEEISRGSEEQTSGINEINNSVTQMDEVTQHNAAMVEESTAAAQSMSEQAEELIQLMSFFKLSQNDSNDNFNSNTSDSSPTVSSAPAPKAKEEKPSNSSSSKSVATESNDGWEEF